MVKNIKPTKTAITTYAPGKIHLMPTMSISAGDRSVENYQTRLATILKQVEKNLPGPYDYTDKDRNMNMGSFTLLPTYNKQEWLGGSDFDTIKKTLEERKEELIGNAGKVTEIIKKQANSLEKIKNLNQDIDQREREERKNAALWSESELAEYKKETEKLHNLKRGFVIDVQKQSEEIREVEGVITALKRHIAEEKRQSPTSSSVHILEGKLRAAEEDKKLIDEGMFLLKRMSSDLVSSPQDASFTKEAKAIALPDDKVQRLLALAATMQTRKAIGTEIRPTMEKMRIAAELSASLTAQVERLRQALHEQKIFTESDRARLERVVESMHKVRESLTEDDWSALFKPEVLNDLAHLEAFAETSKQREEDLEQTYGKSVHAVLRSHSGTIQTRLPSDTPIAWDKLDLSEGNPLARLGEAKRRFGDNLGVFKAWKRDWIDSGKIDAYRDKNGTRDLWLSKEAENLQIGATKELFGLYMNLLELDDFTSPRSTDNLMGRLLTLAKILNGKQDERNDIEYEIHHFDLQRSREEITLRKQQLKDAQERKKAAEQATSQTPVVLPSPEPKKETSLEMLSNDDTWVENCQKLSIQDFTDEQTKLKEAIATSRDLARERIAFDVTKKEGALTRLENIRLKVSEDRALVRALFTEKKDAWQHYLALFISLSDEDKKTLPTDKQQVIQIFLKNRKGVEAILDGIETDYKKAVAYFAQAEQEIKNMQTEYIHLHPLGSLDKIILSNIVKDREDITVESLMRRGLSEARSEDIVAFLKVAGILTS